MFTHLQRAAVSSTRILALLQRQPQMDHRGGLIVQGLQGHVEFQNVHFQFPSRVDAPSLAGVSFEVPAGESVALVGPAFGGKTTIAALLERFYDPQQGRIVLDKKDLCSYDPRWVRDQIGIVTHDPALFATSVAKNISYEPSSPRLTLDAAYPRVH